MSSILGHLYNDFLTENVQSDKEAPDRLGGDLAFVHPAVPGLEVFYLENRQRLLISCCVSGTNRMMELFPLFSSKAHLVQQIIST